MRSAALLVVLAMGVWAEMPGVHASVVVELFTSEGCSSCPPADLLLRRLQREGVEGIDVIPLSFHVDYWNHLGWKDPFSSAAFSDRQQGYGRAFHIESVYTPQMVINGQAECLGSDAPRVVELIRRAAESPHAEVAARALSDGAAAMLAIRMDGLPPAHKGEIIDVVLAMTEDGLASSVTAGENAGRRLIHTGVVRRLVKIAEIDRNKSAGYSADVKTPIDPAWRRDKVRAVVFAQERGSRRVVGAASCTL
ncbi:MAG TPA: DUF1223 domain-containing protein [Bryobacteraceae bacterium]|jgi:hypothetical protein|nr:DUF1223 domain-containing protein [Bryobacteraceae bacterium]